MCVMEDLENVGEDKLAVSNYCVIFITATTPYLRVIPRYVDNGALECGISRIPEVTSLQ